MTAALVGWLMHQWHLMLFPCENNRLQESGIIISLAEVLVWWHQVLIKYLPPEWAGGVQSDILNNLSHDFEGDPAYDLYFSMV